MEKMVALCNHSLLPYLQYCIDIATSINNGNGFYFICHYPPTISSTVLTPTFVQFTWMMPNIVLLYEVNDILNMKPSTTEQPPVRTISLPWLRRGIRVILLGNYWLAREAPKAILYTLDGEHVYTWDNAKSIVVPEYHYKDDNDDISDNDGYFLLKIRDHDSSGPRLYAYNIAMVGDVIESSSLTSSTPLPPSNDYMLSNALASWPLDDIINTKSSYSQSSSR
jgi:hypothetical protein